jgi:putative ABC transport system permease protein
VGFRKVLVVAQFAISVALGISTVVIYRQLNFVQAKNLGFDQSHLLYLNLKGDTRFKAGVIKEQVAQLSGVASVTATTNNLVDVSNSTNFEWEGQTPGAEFLITQMNIDADFLATTGMEMASGRNYSAQITRDTAERDGYYLVNETAAKRMGYNNETVLNKKAKFWGIEGTVIGVVKDFHFRPLNKNIEPFIFRYRPQNPYFQLLIKTKPEGTAATIAALNQIYKKADPDNPIKFGFVDQALEAQYKADQRAGRTVLYFSILAILVSCLGLLGLTAFAAEQRTKEISIRKVLGATVAGIAGLLARDFIRLVVLAIVIATPVAYFGMQKWLANFAYRIDIQWWMLAVVSAVAVVLAGLTVGVQGVKAALANPAHSLRKE